MERILMVDDDRELFQILQQYLSLEGFELTGIHEGQGGVTAALTGDYKLVLLDVMLPNVNGFDVLRQIRGAASPLARVPVLMLTARGDAVDRIVGLEVGADDYLPKPFNERELVARMRAILRRAPHEDVAGAQPIAPVADHRLQVDDVSLDDGERRVWCAENEVELTAVEFDLLAMLVKAAGHVVTRRDIARQVFDRPLSPFDRSLDTHMSNLRRKLGPHAQGGERIKTVRLNDLIGQLLQLARLENLEHSTTNSNAVESATEKSIVDLAALVRDVVADTQFEAGERNRSVTATLTPCKVRGNGALLHSAIENVVRNAIRHTRENTQVEVTLNCGNDMAIVGVRDWGDGVPEESLNELFKPFYRVEAARDRDSGGAGLGLSITERAARWHGGSVRAENVSPHGLRVEITLPLVAELLR